VMQWGIASISVGLLAACGQAPHESASSATAGTATQPSHEEPVLNFANFIEEIAPETLPEFTRETGITVSYDTYELNQVLESRLLERNDPGNQYAVPYVWGTHAFGYDVAKVEAALGGPAPDSWALVFDPKYAAKLAKCGIIVVDAPWVMVSQALTYLGRDPNSERREDLAAALQRLRMNSAHTDACSRQQNREFTRFRTGQ